MESVVALCHFCETHGPRILMTVQLFRESQLDGSSSSNVIQTLNAAACAADVSNLGEPSWCGDAVAGGSCSESPDSGRYEDAAQSCSRHQSQGQESTRQFYGSYDAILRYGGGGGCRYRKPSDCSSTCSSTLVPATATIVTPSSSSATSRPPLIAIVTTADGDRDADEQQHRQEETVGDESTAEEPMMMADDIEANTWPLNEQRCPACTSFGGWEPGFLTNDHDLRISYVSSQFPYHRKIRDYVRQACIRSLSCEVSPGSTQNGGAVFFSDETNGWAMLSHTFTMKDAKARGFQHWYSLVVVTFDTRCLLDSYEYFVSCLLAIIRRLQTKASAVFESEQSTSVHRNATAGRASYLPSGFLRKRTGGTVETTSRPLTTLTGDPRIFKKLHRYLVWMMRQQARRCVEIILEGPPSQDALVAMEMAEQRRRQTSGDHDGGQPQQAPQRHQPVPSPSKTTGGVQFFARDDERRDSADSCPNSHHHHEQQQRHQHHHPLRIYEDLLALASGRVIRQADFVMLVAQLVIGDQVIVLADEADLCRRVLNACAVLLPLGCVKMEANSANGQYLPVFRCNLLGVQPVDAALPMDDIGTALVMKIALPKTEKPRDDDDDALDCNTASLTEFQMDFVRVHNATKYREAQQSSFVQRIEQLLCTDPGASGPILSTSAIAGLLRALREEWLNRAKLLYQLKKQPNIEALDEDRILKVVRCQPADLPVLKFWTNGLSRHYRDWVLAACYGPSSAPSPDSNARPS